MFLKLLLNQWTDFDETLRKESVNGQITDYFFGVGPIQDVDHNFVILVNQTVFNSDLKILN